MITSLNADKATLPFISLDTPINKYRLTMYRILEYRETFSGYYYVNVPVFDCEEVAISYPDIITREAKRLLNALPPEMYEHIISYLDVGTQILALRRRIDLGASYVYIHNREHVYIVTKDNNNTKVYETNGNTTTMTVNNNIVAILGKLSMCGWLGLYCVDFGHVGFTARKWYRLMLDDMGMSDKRLDGPDEKLYAIPRDRQRDLADPIQRLYNLVATTPNKVMKFGNVGDTQYFSVEKDVWTTFNNLMRGMGATHGLRTRIDGSKFIATDAHRKHDAYHRRGRRSHQPHIHRPTHNGGTSHHRR